MFTLTFERECNNCNIIDVSNNIVGLDALLKIKEKLQKDISCMSFGGLFDSPQNEIELVLNIDKINYYNLQEEFARKRNIRHVVWQKTLNNYLVIWVKEKLHGEVNLFLKLDEDRILQDYASGVIGAEDFTDFVAADKLVFVY